MWFSVIRWACAHANMTGGCERPVPINQLVMTCPKTNTLDLSTIFLCWLIGAGLFKLTVRFLWRKGQSYELFFRNDRVTMTDTQSIIQSTGQYLRFSVTNLQNRRPFSRGGLTLCRGHSRHILFTDVSFLIRTAGGDLMSQHYHTKLIAKKTTTRWTP